MNVSSGMGFLGRMDARKSGMLLDGLNGQDGLNGLATLGTLETLATLEELVATYFSVN